MIRDCIGIKRSHSRVVRQRSAKPETLVRFQLRSRKIQRDKAGRKTAVNCLADRLALVDSWKDRIS